MSIFSRRNIIRSVAFSFVLTLAFALAALAFGAPQTMTGGSVAAAFRGEWVPARARCTSPLKLVIGPNVVTFVKGADREEFRKLDQCFTCMGHDVENITLLSTDAMGDSPFMIYLDGSKRKPAVQVQFPNDKKLGERFPFGAASLKKCK
jgi:hypothetical protein